MTARKATFRQADVTRAIKGMRAMGLPIAEVIVNRDGSIRVLTGLKEASPTAADDMERRMREAFGG